MADIEALNVLRKNLAWLNAGRPNTAGMPFGCMINEWQLRELVGYIEGLERDKARLDWLEEKQGLHEGVEFLYVVDGYECMITYDGNTIASFHGPTLRDAMDNTISNASSYV